MAPKHIRMIVSEIELRERRGFAGPDRHKSWRSG
jgi:hypothetical protein